jgi:exopolysaccharide/PEP-CTERM locus tyrosine autokinase
MDKKSTIEKAIERFLLHSDRADEKPNQPVAYLDASPDETDAIKTNETHHQVNANGLLKLDFGELEKQGYITHLKTKSQIAEEFRAIKRPLLRNMTERVAAPIKNANMIMVASSLPGEGKTFTALNLALSIVAERERTVLLVDCDVVNPTLSRVLGMDEQPGIIDVLNNRYASLADVMYKTDVERLRFIPAGHLNEFSTELLASNKMKLLAEEISTRYSDRIIIFDSPPLLVTSQAAVLSHLMGQKVLVIESGKTPQSAVDESLNLFDKDEVVGLVLNKSRRSSLRGYYYGSYYDRN